MTTKRAKQLEKLAMSLPSANQQLAQGQQQARQIQLQEQIKQAPTSVGPGFAQQLGAQQAQQAGQIQLGAQQKTQTQAQLVGQMGLEEQARQQRQEGFQQQLALSANQRDTANRLANLDQRLKSQLLDDQLQFQRDQAGRASFNDRQLLDYAALNSRNQQEYMNYVQQAQQMQDREMQLLKAAEQKLTQVINQGYIKKGKRLDQQLKVELTRKKRELQKQIQDKQNKAANRAAMFQAGGAILGTAAGALAGPTGAAIGGSIGSGVGTALGGLSK
jgi:hypothetical protein